MHPGLEAILRSKTRTHALLERAAAGAGDPAGCRCVMELLALLASDRCTWRKGEVHVELTDAGESTFIDVFVGKRNTRDRAMPTIVLTRPFRDVRADLEAMPDCTSPLHTEEARGKVILTSDEGPHRRATVKVRKFDPVSLLQGACSEAARPPRRGR